MKFFILLTFFTLSAQLVPEAQAQAQVQSTRPNYTRNHRTSVQVYCEEARFRNYMDLALGMRDFVTPNTYARVYLPLKILASKALLTLRNYGPLSATTHQALYEIVSFVSNNEREFDELWEVEAFFPVAQDLMEMTQSLERDLK